MEQQKQLKCSCDGWRGSSSTSRDWKWVAPSLAARTNLYFIVDGFHGYSIASGEAAPL